MIQYDHNALNQLIKTQSPETLFKYDASGNMTQGYTPEGYLFTASYDAENRLKAIEFNDTAVDRKVEYIYASNSLISEIKTYENQTLTSDTHIIRDGFLPLQERNTDNTVLREYTWGLNMGGGVGGLLNLNQNGSNYTYHYDGKGNVVALTDSSQSLAAAYRYDVFGVLKTKSGTLNQPFQFSTKRYDERTGLIYYGYRFYNPSLGRWINRDPIAEAGGINLYGFVQNDPINLIDPDGLSPVGWVIRFTKTGMTKVRSLGSKGAAQKARSIMDPRI